MTRSNNFNLFISIDDNNSHFCFVIATGAFDYELGETTGFPFDLETPEQIPGYSGSYVIPKGLEENVIKLHQFLYPNKDYTPTATVTDISNTLNDMTNVYPNTTESGTSQNE